MSQRCSSGVIREDEAALSMWKQEDAAGRVTDRANALARSGAVLKHGSTRHHKSVSPATTLIARP